MTTKRDSYFTITSQKLAPTNNWGISQTSTAKVDLTGQFVILPSTMTLTTHAVIGAIIGGATGDPYLAFSLGFGSHFLVDIIPRGDRELYEGHKTKTAQKRAVAFVIMDAITALIVVSLMFAYSPDHTLSFVLAMGIIGSVLPDFINGIYEAWEVQSLEWFNRFHFFFHNLISDRSGDVPLRYGLIGQLVVIVFLQRYF